MIILDTDLVSLLQRSSSAHSRLLNRIQVAERDETIATTIITYEEQTRGWFSLMSSARTMRDQILAYDRLLSHIRYFAGKKIIPLTEPAAVHLQQLRSLKLKIATMDLKIAAIALANDATLWSRNLKDFRRVPGLRVEDASA